MGSYNYYGRVAKSPEKQGDGAKTRCQLTLFCYDQKWDRDSKVMQRYPTMERFTAWRDEADKAMALKVGDRVHIKGDLGKLPPPGNGWQQGDRAQYGKALASTYVIPADPNTATDLGWLTDQEMQETAQRIFKEPLGGGSPPQQQQSGNFAPPPQGGGFSR